MLQHMTVTVIYSDVISSMLPRQGKVIHKNPEHRQLRETVVQIWIMKALRDKEEHKPH